MYDDLAKMLRVCGDSNNSCGNCPVRENDGCCPHGEWEFAAEKYMLQAADAIEELSREVEEYKAAYREEHNKRIAENRYLYDELTKAVREKLLMTPMRIEVPEQPEEG